MYARPHPRVLQHQNRTSPQSCAFWPLPLHTPTSPRSKDTWTHGVSCLGPDKENEAWGSYYLLVFDLGF